jgi:hypothetical protein
MRHTTIKRKIKSSSTKDESGGGTIVREILKKVSDGTMSVESAEEVLELLINKEPAAVADAGIDPISAPPTRSWERGRASVQKPRKNSIRLAPTLRERILDYLSADIDLPTSTEIARALHKEPASISSLMCKLTKEGKVYRFSKEGPRGGNTYGLVKAFEVHSLR